MTDIKKIYFCTKIEKRFHELQEVHKKLSLLPVHNFISYLFPGFTFVVFIGYLFFG